LTKTNLGQRRKEVKVAELASKIEQFISAASEKEGKYLTFNLAGEEYGIGILKIKEIIGMMPITPVPRTAEFVKGVINLRGKVIPVIDLRLRFGMERVDYSDRTSIIVIEAQRSNAVKCWDMKKCEKQECPAHESKDFRCWMISGTLCRDEIQGSFHEKIEACRKCDVYGESQERKAIFSMGLVVDSVSEVTLVQKRFLAEID
jgi:CheW-like domain